MPKIDAAQRILDQLRGLRQSQEHAASTQRAR
jgi:hypothetical protein